MAELSPVQRRIKDYETQSTSQHHHGAKKPIVNGKAMKPSTKPNTPLSKPGTTTSRPKKAISSPTFRRSAGLSKMLAPAQQPSPARPTRSTRASEIRRTRLAERAASPPSNNFPAAPSPSTRELPRNSRSTTQQSRPETPTTSSTASSSPSRKRLGTMVAERMKERRYISPSRIKQQEQPTTPTVSEVSTPRTKTVGEMVAERLQQPRTPRAQTPERSQQTTTKTGSTLGSLVADRLQERGRITSPKQKELISRIAEQRRRRDPSSPTRNPVSPISSVSSIALSRSPPQQNNNRTSLGEVAARRLRERRRSRSPPKTNDPSKTNEEPSLGVVATERVRERRRIRSQRQQANEAEESLVFSHSPPHSPETPESRSEDSPTKRKLPRPGIGAMVVARRKEKLTSSPLSPKSIQVAARMRDQKRQRSPSKPTHLVQQAMARGRTPLSPQSLRSEMSSIARMRQSDDTFSDAAFPNDPFDPFEQDRLMSPHAAQTQFITQPTQDTPNSRAPSHHLHLPDLASYEQNSPTRSSAKDIHSTHSAELQYVTDDEMTLTNVRQLVETAREATLKHPPPQPLQKDEYYMDNIRRQQQQQHHLEQVYSSSSYDGESRLQPNLSNGSQMTPDISSFYDRNPRLLRDDDTYDYGARDATDEGSQGSLSYTERQWRKERDARRAAAAAAQAEMEGPFMKHDDVEHYRKAVDTPLGRTAIGVAAAATVGCIVIGPVGLLLGAAAVGIGVGYMQIPEEERTNMNSKASEAMNKFRETALHASDKLSNTCATTYRESGVADHVPAEIQTFCNSCAADIEESTVGVVAKDGTDASIVGKEEEEEEEVTEDVRRIITPPNNRIRMRDKIQCLRKGKVIPISQIYRLNPTAQRRAWLDVLASAETSNPDKLEATEEVIILSKDKQISRFFVSEGILDCLMWTIGRYLEKKNRGPGSEFWHHPEITPAEASAAKLAASCCLTLGKSYCAAMHTEGDLQLMSMYERGTVPEERQLAQMLLEVPYHRRATKTEDPTVIENEVFAMKQLTLPEAEELATAIASIAREAI